jgi:hypothetical protein
MSGPNLEGYVEVADRITAFYEKHPEGSLQCKEWHMEEVGDKLFVVYTALAYRTPDDARPGVGTAWEPFPGKTNFTRDSELMNCETSSWGRALAALGFVGKKIASAEEVRNRQAADTEGKTSRRQPDGSPKLSEKQKGLIKKLVGQKEITVAQLEIILSEIGAPMEVNEGWVDRLSGGREGQGSALIERLMDGPIPEVAPTLVPASDVPSDDPPTHASQDPGPDIPWEADAA